MPASATPALYEVRAIPAVVQADDIRALRQVENRAAAGEFAAGYLGFDERSRRALDASVRSLASEGGGSWFFNGVFGSGKSHLLGVLTLLADGAGHEAFGAIHPHLAPALESFPARLAVHCSLDAYPATRFSLEEVFWREVGAEWQRRGLPAAAMQFDSLGPRGEAFAAMEAALTAHGLHGLVICIDELSLFLSGREHRGLQNDAAFLQFLGQRARRRAATRAPLWVFAALQKTVEDIGDLDAYVIAQIRDRFTTLPLSLAHLPSLIRHRLIVRRDEEAAAALNNRTYDALLRALPRLDFDRDQWDRLYPFHPATISLLEAAATRFLSRTRSAVLFCSDAAAQGLAEDERVLPAALFDFIEPALSSHPDLRSLLVTWRNWRGSLNDIAAGATEAGYLGHLMKALLLYKIAGTAPSVAQLANAVALDARLPGDGNYVYARILLEKLRERGGSLVMERRAGSFNDRYTIDFGARVGEMARRFTANALHTLPVGDRRIGAYALSCCREESLPLASLPGSGQMPTLWRNTPRTISLHIATEPPPADSLANCLGALNAPGGDDFALWVVAPFPAMADDREIDVAGIWREAMREASSAAGEARWRNALVWWIPRAPSRDEWQFAREAAAQHRLLQDPALRDNRRGRSVLEFLKNGQLERERLLARLVAKLLREGAIANAAGVAVDAAELAGTESWSATLEALAALVLPGVFPKAEAVTPRLRVLTPANAEALCLEILRRPADAPYFTPQLERAVRAIAAPLAVATEEKGRWKIAGGNEELARELCALVHDAGGASPAAIEAHFAKSAWGLDADQTRIMVCALLRGGELAAFDGRGHQLVTREIGMPLRRSVHALRPGKLVDSASWKSVQQLTRLLTGHKPGALSFREQEHTHALLANWRSDVLAQVELAQARLNQLRRQLHHDPAQWPHAEAAIAAVSELLHVTEEAPACELLTRFAATGITALRPLWQRWLQLAGRLEERLGPLLQAHAFLSHPELASPPELQERRGQLLAHFENGESVLHDDALLELFETWRNDYVKAYTEWHRAQHAPERFLSLRRLAGSDAARALLALASLQQRDFPAGRELQSTISAELAKSCGRDGTPQHGPLCPVCRLRYGQRITLLDPLQLESRISEGMEALRAALEEEAVRTSLARDENGFALLQWAGEHQSDETLLPLLNEAALKVLDDAFRPRRRVGRSWGDLQSALQTCRTRTEYETAFTAWLDAGEGLRGDDEIVIYDSAVSSQ